MPHLSLCVAIAASAVATSAANAAVISYQFNGSLTSNSIASGGFAGASVGVPVSLQITIETTTSPVFSTANRNHWDGVSGTILAMKATVDGYTSVVTPNSAPVRARVVDDAVNSSVYIDQFWFEVNALAPSPDFTVGSAILSSVGAAPPISSSLSGIDWPMTSAEVDASSFGLEHYIILRGAANPQFLRADITSVFVAPSPGPVAAFALGGLGAIRRRRA